MRRHTSAFAAPTRATNQGDAYFQEISSQNPFRVPEIESHARLQEEEHRDRMRFLEQTPVYRRAPHSARSQFLGLQDSTRPSRPQTSRTTVSQTGSLNYAELRDRFYAPVGTGKFRTLQEDDREFLENLPREAGPAQSVQRFVDRQKEIFLVGLTLQDKCKEKDQLAGELKLREQEIRRLERHVDLEVQRFDAMVRRSDVDAVQNIVLQEKAARGRMALKQTVDQLGNQIRQTQGDLDKLQMRLEGFLEQKRFLLQLGLCGATLDQQEMERNTCRARLEHWLLEHGTADGFCFECAKEGANQGKCSHEGHKVDYSSSDIEPQLLQYFQEISAQKNDAQQLGLLTDLLILTFYHQEEAVPFDNALGVMNALRYKDMGNEILQRNLSEQEEQLDKARELSKQRRAKLDQQVLSAQQAQEDLLKRRERTTQRINQSSLLPQLGGTFSQQALLEKMDQQIQLTYLRLMNEDPNGLSLPRMLCTLESMLERLGNDAIIYEKLRRRAQNFAQQPPSQEKFEKDRDLARQKFRGEQKQQEKDDRYREKMLSCQQKAQIPPKTIGGRPASKRVWWERRQIGTQGVQLAEQRESDFYGRVD